MSSLLIRGSFTLFGVREHGQTGPLRGKELAHLPVQEAGHLFILDGVISSIGNLEDAPDRADQTIDASGSLILPCWCDSHSHVVFARSRESEFVDRIHGLTYEEIAARGGGILNSAQRLRETHEDDLFESAMTRIREVISMGTGALEIKSGYGLDLPNELKMLRLIRRIKETATIPVVATFLGAHAVPKEFEGNADGYVSHVMHDMLPVIAEEGLADYLDVFCDRGFFSVDQMSRIIEAGAKYGLKAKVHVSQLENFGGVQAAVESGALSVDHLENIGEPEIQLLSRSETIATLLPSCSFFLNEPYAPARSLIDRGAAVALATDYNPGSTPSGNIPFVISLACIKMRMTPEEAVNAATINGAAAMEMSDKAGSLWIGGPANLIITRSVPSLAYIPYAFGSDHIDKVVINGRVESGR